MILGRSELTELVHSGVVSRDDGKEIAVDFTSIGLHLDSQFLRYTPSQMGVPPFDATTQNIEPSSDGTIQFAPGAAVLACSVEKLSMPLDVMGFIQTKGSLARGFVMAHLCDGQIDPGYHGKITLELVNLGPVAYRLSPGMPIAQLFFMKLTSPVESGYQGRYQGATGPTSMKARK